MLEQACAVRWRDLLPGGYDRIGPIWQVTFLILLLPSWPLYLRPSVPRKYISEYVAKTTPCKTAASAASAPDIMFSRLESTVSGSASQDPFNQWKLLLYPTTIDSN